MEKVSKIVVIDDDAIVTSTLKTLLSLEGFSNVEYFNDPQNALEFMVKNEPDLVISDFMMPGMNGLELLVRVKELYPQVSTILLTGYADKENAIRAINEVGIYKYIEKPWDNADLVMNINNGLERSNLLAKLGQKVAELEHAHLELERYSHSLEDMVAQKTRDLSDANTRLSAVIDNCADGIIIISKEGRVESANPACEYLFGLSERLLREKHFSQLAICEDENFSLEDVEGLKDAVFKEFSIKNFVKNWSSSAQISFSSIVDENAPELAEKYVCVVRDMTLEKEAQRLRDDFIATLTHDLRTPLLAAIQTLEYFLSGTLGELQDRQNILLDTMRKSNEDMLGLVNALLEVYKYEAGKLSLCKTNFILNNLIDDCAKQMQPLSDKLGLDLVLDLTATEKVEISADRNELKRVMINLISNGIHHTKQGSVTVKTGVQDANVMVQVIDTGIGISQEDMKHLFKRFSQGTTQKRSCSTGLGLYLSRQIIEAHQGKIWSESTMGRGSVFSFLLTDVVVERAGMVFS